jgi:tRNA-dihydrouridine synthase B
VRGLPDSEAFREHMNILDTCGAQHAAVAQYFAALAAQHERLPQSIANAQVEEAEILL